MLAMQTGQGGGRTAAASAQSSSAASHRSTTAGTAAADHRQNGGESTEHRREAEGQKDTHGFRNYGQFVAASHASEHLHIPLADLKKAMVDNNLSLGQAIHKLQPALSPQQIQAETKKAEAAAHKAEASPHSSCCLPARGLECNLAQGRDYLGEISSVNKPIRSTVAPFAASISCATSLNKSSLSA